MKDPLLLSLPGTVPPGIPTIPFGNTETVESVYGDANYYTHWVDNTHPSATDTSNPTGTPTTPRLTIPYLGNLAAGSVVQLRGGPYWTSGGTGQQNIGGLGTAQAPIFVRGESPESKVEVQRGIRVYPATYLIIENIEITGQYALGVECRPSSAADAMHHICVRRCDFIGTGVFAQNTGLSFIGISGSDTTDCAGLFNYFTGIGDSDSLTENDQHQLGVASYTDRIWYGWNQTYDNGGDGCGNGHAAGRTAKNYYIFNNHFKKNHENGIDIKEVAGCRIIGNTIEEMTGRDSDPGTGIVIHYGPDIGPTDVYVLRNEVFNCRQGMQCDTTVGLVIAGNIIHDIDWNKGPVPGTEPDWNSTYAAGACIFIQGVEDAHIVNNTFYDYNVGIAVPSSPFDTLLISNNLFAGRTAANAHEINVQGAEPFSSTNNFFDSGVAPRFRWGSTTRTLAQAQAAGQETGSIEGSADFTNAAAADLSLTATSDAIEAGSVDAVWAQMETDLGESVAYDFNGGVRPWDAVLDEAGGDWDIGAYEFGSPPPNAGAPVNTVAPSISGTTNRDETLTTNRGTWTGSPSPTYAYQWVRCDADGLNPADIASATSSTYVLVQADVGGTIKVRVTATNTEGSASATSAATAVIGNQIVDPPTFSAEKHITFPVP